MEKHRFYYRLKKSIGELCKENEKDLPSEKVLGRIAREKGFAFNEKSVQPALYDNAPFADGLLHSLSIWLEIPTAGELVDLTLDCPKHREARIGDFFLLGMRPLVEKLTGGHRLRETAFFKSQSDVERATEITLRDFGACYWESDAEPTSDELIETARRVGGLPAVEDYHRQLGSFWQFNPLTIIYAVTSSKNKVGVSCVLPLSETAYNEVREGKKSVFELSTSDLVWTSNRQLIFIGAVRKDDKNQTPTTEQTKCLASSIFIQIAMMATDPLEDLQVLSFGGTPDNEKRLEQNGFVDLGINEPTLKVPLFEINKGQPSFGWATKLLYSIQAANR